MNKIKVSYLHVAIMMILTFGIGYLPPFGLITDVGMKVLGVFIGIMYGWIFIDLLWTSVFGFVALGLTGYFDILGAFGGGFGNSNFILCLICSIFAAGLSEIGVTDNIAYWLLSKKVFIGRPWLLIATICVAAMLMGLGNGTYAGVFLLWALVNSIGSVSGYKKGNRLLNMMIAFIVYAAFTAPNVVPFYGGPILYGSFFTKGTDLTIEAAPFFLMGMTYLILALAIMILFAKYVLKIDASRFSTTAELCEKYRKHKASKYQKVGLILLLVYFIVLMLPEIITTLPGRDFLRGIGVVGFSVLYMVIFIVWKKEDGESVLNLEKAFQGIPWAVMMLLGLTYPLAEAMESADVGITATINSALVPLLSHLDVTILIILSTIMLGLITQVMHNVVIGAMFIPIITPLVVEMGGNPQTAFFMLYIALMCAYVTPAGSMMAGMVFGNKDIPRKDAYLFGILFFSVTMVLLICLMPVCNIVF